MIMNLARRYIIQLLAALFVLTLLQCSNKGGTPPPPPPPGPKTFTNPLQNGADPWVFKKDSFYYYTQTLGNRIAIWMTKKCQNFRQQQAPQFLHPPRGHPIQPIYGRRKYFLLITNGTSIILQAAGPT